MKNPEQLLTYLKTLVLTKGLDVVLGIIIFFIGRWLIRQIIKFVQRRFAAKDVDISLRSFLLSIIKFTLYIMLALTVASTMGFATSSFLTVVGAAGLSIGLALQGSLSNFAGGVLILLFKPFKVGDFITSTNSVSGTVEAIDILYTSLKTPDGMAVYAPNGPLANAVITNYSQKDSRRMELNVRITYKTDIEKARGVILDLLGKDKFILKNPPPEVHVSEFGDSSVNLIVRAWAMSADYWPALFRSRENIKRSFDQNDISIPVPQTEMRIISDKNSAEKLS